MSIVVTEKHESRRFTASRDGKASTLELVLHVVGTDDHVLAKAAADGFSPQTQGVGNPLLWKQSVTVEPILIAGESSRWLATVYYDTSGPEPLSAANSFEFSTTGGIQRVTQSIATRARYPADAPNYQGAIGVTDHSVEGVDITVPLLQFSETHHYAELSPAQKAVLINLSGTINLNPFRGLSGGEVLFLGVDARREDSKFETPWVVTYQFAVQRNRTNFLVGDIPVAQKYGWDYMWIRYGLVEDNDSSSLLHVPVAVYVEQVYRAADFALLGIGP